MSKSCARSSLFDTALAAATHNINQFKYTLSATETGRLLHLSGGIAQVSGLPSVGYDELVCFDDSVTGVVVDIAPNQVGIMMLGDSTSLSAGSEVIATGQEVDTPVGEQLLGRVLDATGRPLDKGDSLRNLTRRPVESAAPSILDRAPVTEPLQTGIKVVDALVPVGRGQRELIIGDRQTGKTALAIDTIINQRNKDVLCIYCAIGQRGSAVANVIDSLRFHKALNYTSVVVASDEDPPGLRFITPYAAMSMAEHFMRQGRDVLLIFDDLTRHARAYRELSLLLRRPPGREAYPGDVFYIHSRLLERATQLHSNLGGGSITSLPVVETQAQDISAYIPTNLISITDGQIYLSPTLFHKGVLPAVDVGLSVSRVGGKTQSPAYRKVAGDLRLSHSQFEELETFARFDTRLDDTTRGTIEHGRRVREILKQAENKPLSSGLQIITLRAVSEGLLDKLPLSAMAQLEQLIQQHVSEHKANLLEKLDQGMALSEEEWLEVDTSITDCLTSYENTLKKKTQNGIVN